MNGESKSYCSSGSQIRDDDEIGKVVRANLKKELCKQTPLSHIPRPSLQQRLILDYASARSFI